MGLRRRRRLVKPIMVFGGDGLDVTREELKVREGEKIVIWRETEFRE